MKTSFKVNATAFPDMLRNPPPQFAHLGLLYAFLNVHVGDLTFPSEIWCDFSGALLLHWNREVRNLIEHKSRYARLVFTDTPNEVWLRPTNTSFWKASCVTWRGRERTIVEESLCVPEYVEASLHHASCQLLTAALGVGVWYEDCQALQDFIEGRISLFE